jgi:hypothetical protein
VREEVQRRILDALMGLERWSFDLFTLEDVAQGNSVCLVVDMFLTRFQSFLINRCVTVYVL